jgi:colanic acid biosynthesis glycosyl transferase WcaI
MRILMLSQWFDPEPSFKGLLFARELVRRGHQVEVLTGFPNYPGGKLYPGYTIRPWQHDMMDEVPVHRVALYPSHDHSETRRIANYASFGMSAALLGPFLVRRPDVIYVYNEVSLAPAALLLKSLWGTPFVYDIVDLWPDSVVSSKMLHSQLLLGALGRWCSWVYRTASHVVVYTPGVRAELHRRGLPLENSTLIYNWCDERAIYPHHRDGALAARFDLAGTFNVMFAGTMGIVQALDAVLDAAGGLRDARPDIRFVFVGGGIERDRLEAIAGQRGLSNVMFLPRQPMEAMGSILALADVLLVHLKDDPLFRITIPSKTQAYLAAGIPVLMGVRGDAADLILRSGGGQVCEPESPKSIIEGVLRLYGMSSTERQAMGRSGRAFYERELSLRVGVSRFEETFSHVIARKATPS